MRFIKAGFKNAKSKWWWMHGRPNKMTHSHSNSQKASRAARLQWFANESELKPSNSFKGDIVSWWNTAISEIMMSSNIFWHTKTKKRWKEYETTIGKTAKPSYSVLLIRNKIRFDKSDVNEHLIFFLFFSFFKKTWSFTIIPAMLAKVSYYSLRGCLGHTKAWTWAHLIKDIEWGHLREQQVKTRL